MLGAGVLGAAALFVHSPAQTQVINDVPMAVKNNVAPNFMFMIDNSGSMSNIVPTAPYDAGIDYTPSSNCSGSQILSAGTSVDLRIATAGSGGSQGRRSFIRSGGNNFRHSTQTDTNAFGSNNYRCFSRNSLYPARLLADSNSNTEPSGYLASEYTGNYLNWYFSTTCSGTTFWSGNRKPTGSCTGSLVETRMEIARTAAKAAVDGAPKPATASADTAVRIGLSTYNSGDGGRLIVPVKNLSFTDDEDTITHVGRTPIKSAIEALTPSGNTPLAETLGDIGRYFATGYNGNIATANNASVGIDDFFYQGRNSCLSWSGSRTACVNGSTTSTNHARRPPITEWCQRSYVFMLTDGRSQGDQAFVNNTYMRDYDRDCTGANAGNCVANAATSQYDRKTSREYESQGSDYFDDVAKALFDIDLRPDLTAPAGRTKKNNALTYVIGFADTQVQNDPLLINTAAQGGGKFINAADDVALVSALRSVMTDAFAKDAASAAVSVANAQITVNNISYAPSYNSGSWYGDLEAYALDTTSGAQIRPAVWSARDLLNARTPASRKIATFTGTAGAPFQPGLANRPTSLTDDVINYLRGTRTLEDTDGDGIGLRPRLHLLGDLINAEPYVVTYAGGVPIVFQGANDGMLHVFDGRTSTATGNTSGQELWAYVPRAVQSRLSQLSTIGYEHQYYVDSTPAAAEITGSGAMTRLLVGGLGKGGGAYYALDITSFSATDENALASKVKWEFTNANLGYTFGTPLIVRTAAGWRVVVSSGYGNGTGGPNGNGDGRGYVWVLDPATGTIVSTMPTPSGVGSASDPAGLAHLSKPANTAEDAIVRYVYGGDLLGNVWRFDLDSIDSTATQIAQLRDGSGAAQPITAPLEVGPVSGSSTKFYVYVGTGRYLADEDVPGNAGANTQATQRQSLYAIIDDTAQTSPSLPNIRGSNGSTCPSGGGNGELVCQSLNHDSTRNVYTATTHTLVTTHRGWYLDLPADTRLTNGRITGKPVITTGGTLALTANVPTAVKCDPGGSSWFFALSGQNGGAVPIDSGGTTYYDAGTFLGYALASRVVPIETSGGKVGLIQMSDRRVESVVIPETAGVPCLGPSCSCPTCPPASNTWRRIYWRQLK
jgi:type IV pilus assembly protein PilY1